MSKNMFKNRKYFPLKSLSVGVDIAKNKHCARASSGDGQFMTKKPYYFENNLNNFRKFLSTIEVWQKEAGCDDVVVGMEPTGPYWKCLADFLEKNGIRVVTVSPYLVKKMKEAYDNTRGKNDPKDAGLISLMVIEGKILTGATLKDEEENLKHLMGYREVLTRDRTACMNRMHSLLAEYFPERELVFKGIDGTASLKMLKLCPLPCDIIEKDLDELEELLRANSRGRFGLAEARRLLDLASSSIGRSFGIAGFRFVICHLVDEIEKIESNLDEVDEEINTILNGLESYQYLKSIPCIGNMTIASVISAVGDFGNYRSADAVIKQLGLQLYEISSGSKKGNRHISKRGASLPRVYLYMSALVSSKTNGIYHDKFIQMKEKKHGLVIMVALMRKLVKLMYALATQKRFYEAEYLTAVR